MSKENTINNGTEYTLTIVLQNGIKIGGTYQTYNSTYKFYDKGLAEEKYNKFKKWIGTMWCKANNEKLKDVFPINEKELPIIFSKPQLGGVWSPRYDMKGTTYLGETKDARCTTTTLWYTASDDIEKAKELFNEKAKKSVDSSDSYYSQRWV